MYKILFFLVLPFFGISQDFIDARYNRAGITLLVDNKNEAFFSGIKVDNLDDKYYYNSISDGYISFDQNSDGILNKLNKNSISSKALNNLRNLSSLLERAKYSLSDDKVNLLKSTSRGLEGVKDEKWLKDIVKNNYVLVISFRNIQNIDNLYAKKDVANAAIGILGGSNGEYSKRNREGYMANVDCFLFKIELDDADYAAFWKYWNNEDAHQSHNYKMMLVSQSSCRVDCTLPTGSNSNFQSTLLKYGAIQALEHLGNTYFPIASKVGIEQSSPIRAKIGKKEGVFTDQLFFTYEYRNNRRGSITTKKTGVVRAKIVADNRFIASGNSGTTEFYKVNWGKYKEGMFLVQKKDKGFAVSVGAGNEPNKNLYTRISYSLTKSLNISSISQLRLYGEFGFFPKFIDENSAFQDYSISNGGKFFDANQMHSIYYGVGFEKEFYFLGGIQLVPFVSLINERATYSNQSLIKEMLGKYELPKKYGEVLYFKGGVRMPLNILYNLKIVPMISFSTRTFKSSKGLGFTEKFKDYPNKIVISNGSIFTGLELKYEF